MLKGEDIWGVGWCGGRGERFGGEIKGTMVEPPGAAVCQLSVWVVSGKWRGGSARLSASEKLCARICEMVKLGETTGMGFGAVLKEDGCTEEKPRAVLSTCAYRESRSHRRYNFLNPRLSVCRAAQSELFLAVATG
jgi:hypothetical protein